MVRNLGKTSAQQRFHDYGPYALLVEFRLQILRIRIPVSGMSPVDPVQLDLDEVPMVLVVESKQTVEAFLVSVEREAEVADTSRFTLFHEEIYDSVVTEPPVEDIFA